MTSEKEHLEAEPTLLMGRERFGSVGDCAEEAPAQSEGGAPALVCGSPCEGGYTSILKTSSKTGTTCASEKGVV